MHFVYIFCINSNQNVSKQGFLVGKESWILPGGRWWKTLYGSVLAGTALMISLAGAKYFARASLTVWSIVTVVLTTVLISFLISGEKQVWFGFLICLNIDQLSVKIICFRYPFLIPTRCGMKQLWPTTLECLTRP